MKHYDLTGCKVIEAIDTPWIYTNDNLTPEEKQDAYEEYCEWFMAVCEGIKAKSLSVYPNVVYLEDYLG